MRRIVVWLESSPLWLLILAAIFTAAALGCGFTYAAYLLAYGPPENPVPFWEGRIGAERLESLARMGFAGAALVVGAGAAVIAFRNQLVKEEAHRREGTKVELERYVTSAEQLGSASAAVRIAGVHAMSALASEASTAYFRQQCVSVLCSYLRMPPGPASPYTFGGSAADPYEAHVRMAVQNVLSRQLSRDSPTRWREVDIDLRGAQLTSFSLDNVDVRSISLEGATINGDFFMQRARVRAQTDFRNVRFRGGAHFLGSNFEGRARFYGSRFEEAASFVSATFGSLAWFYDAEFCGPTGFASCRFSSTVGFDRAQFRGKAGFLQASFGGDARFTAAEFHAAARFRKAEFRKAASFARTQFHGKTQLGASSFQAGADFRGATKMGAAWLGPVT